MKSLDLLACHMVGDYITQTGHMAANKLSDPKVRAQHVTVYVLGFVPALVPALLLQKVSFWRKLAFLVSLWLSHFVTDSRRWASGEEWPPKPILVDQSIHLATLAILHRILK